MRKGTVRAVLDAVREHGEISATFCIVVQRAVAEQTAELFRVGYLVARKILRVSVAVKS